MTGGPEPGVPESFDQTSGKQDRGVPRGYTNSEAALGGADAVPDTPAVARHGADLVTQADSPYSGPDRRGTPRGTAKGAGTGARGIGVGYWVVGAIVLLIALIYLVGFFG